MTSDRSTNAVLKKARIAWSQLRGLYWFIPGVLTVLAVVASLVTIHVDRNLDDTVFPAANWIFSGGVDGSREVLSAIAGSVVTVAGVVFSVTIVTLSLAAQQYGPRLLRNFIRDRPSQFAFGIFAATFVYCILILRAVRGENDFVESAFVPHISVALSVGLAIMSVFVLIFFIHHTALSIQASAIAERTSEELRATIHSLYPESIGEEAPREAETHFRLPPSSAAVEVKASSGGYLETVNDDDLMRLAQKEDVVIELLVQPGDWVVRGKVVARVWGVCSQGQDVSERLVKTLVLGKQRTMEDDAAFGFDMLLQMAVRAVSSALNDPFTAALCIHHMEDCLLLMASRKTPSPVRLDESGRPRIVAQPKTVGGIAKNVTRHLHHYAKDDPIVLHALSSLVSTVSRSVMGKHDKVALRVCQGMLAGGHAGSWM